MNKTEAIKVLKKELQIIDDPNVTMTAREWEEHDDHMRDALEMAIEALEHEPTAEYSSDVISRQAAIDAICEDGTMFERQGQYSMTMADRKQRDADILDALPSAQPFTAEQIQTMQELESAQVEKAYELGKADRPTGHWIENAQEYYEMINEKGGGVDENTPYFTDDIACSECLAKFSVIDNETERFDFCPNCGCAMKGGEEE